MFSLLYFGHSKVEVVTLEGVKLVDIEFKRHDPHKIVENHLAQFNMKRYVHENSPYDEIFRGFRSYEEVHNIFQTLPLDQQVGFLNFQRHRRNNLPKVEHNFEVEDLFFLRLQSYKKSSLKKSGAEKIKT